MNSSEEYLDNLLKNLLAGENKAETESGKDGQDSPEALFASIGDVSEEEGIPEPAETQGDQQEITEPSEANKAMSTDEIEEMFASMGGSLLVGNDAEEERIPTGETVPVLRSEPYGQTMTEADEDVDYIVKAQNGPQDQDKADGASSDDWASEEKSMFEEPEDQEEAEADDWALEEENLLEESEDQEEVGADGWALEEENLFEEPEDQEEAGADDWALEEENLPEEPEDFGLENWELGGNLPEDPELDEWALEEVNLPAESAMQRELGLEDWALEEENLPEEFERLEEESFSEKFGAGQDDLVLEEPVLEQDDWELEESELGKDDWGLEEPEPGQTDWGLEESELGQDDWELEESEPEQDDFILEEPGSGSDGLVPDEPESVPDNPALEEDIIVRKPDRPEEPEIDEWSLDEDTLMKELEQNENGELADWNLDDDVSGEDSRQNDEFALDDWELEEDPLEELPEKAVAAEEEDGMDDLLSEGETALEKPVIEEDGADDLLSADLMDFDLSGEEDAVGGTMSEEDIDKLLGDDFALEESGEDDEGLSELLAGMGQNEDLSEINNLLEQADKGLMEDDDMMALLGNPPEGAEESTDAFDFWGQTDIPAREESTIREIVPKDAEDDPKKKKEKKRKKKRKEKNGKGETEMEGKDTPKKPGFFARFLEFLLEDEDDLPDGKAGGADDELLLGTLSDENRELLDELNAEDRKKTKKKDKKKKAKKDDKDPKKKAKEKKPQKPKKPKKEKKPKAEEPGVPEKKISRTKILFVVLFCTSVAVCIIVVNRYIPDHMQKQEARERYESAEYEAVYDLLYGKELNAEEEELLRKSNTILQVKAKLRSYENYSKMGMQMEALNALIEGVERYQLFHAEAELYGVSGEVDGIYAQILAQLSGNYGVSEADAMDILASGDDLTYSEKLYAIINGTWGREPEEEQPKIRQDILPEEEEIIDRLDNADAPAEDSGEDL